MNGDSFRVKHLLLFTILITFVLLPATFAQTPSTAAALEDQLKADLSSGPCKNNERVEAVKALFKKMGASDEEIKAEKIKDIQNVVVTKKGKSDETVIIGAHYDKVSDGCGIIDNWSGVVILAHLYKTLSKMETQKTYVFVAFDKEEVGKLGSAAMAKAIPKEKRSSYCAMVNLDAFGLGYSVILENVSNSKMIKAAKDLAGELKAPITGLNLAGVASSDSASFIDKDIPAITLSALSNKWPEFMHSSKDKMENVVIGSVRIGYLFGLEYVKKIDKAGCADFR
ncbi:MAG: M28 family metallopeptidase [Pyrinomonadaceae bacterium]